MTKIIINSESMCEFMHLSLGLYTPIHTITNQIKDLKIPLRSDKLYIMYRADTDDKEGEKGYRRKRN